MISMQLIYFTSVFTMILIQTRDFANNEFLGNWLYFIPITVFFVALFNSLINYNNRLKKYTIIKSFALAIAQILLGFIKNGFSGLIVGQILKNIVNNKELLLTVSLKKIRVLAKKYIDFPRYNMPHALIGNISSNLPIYIFTPFFGSW